MKVYDKIKQFIIDNGFTSLLVLAFSMFAFVFLHSKAFGFGAIGFFLGRNWEIVAKYINQGINEVKEKF